MGALRSRRSDTRPTHVGAEIVHGETKCARRDRIRMMVFELNGVSRILTSGNLQVIVGDTELNIR